MSCHIKKKELLGEYYKKIYQSNIKKWINKFIPKSFQLKKLSTNAN